METLRIEIPENVRQALKRTPEEMARDMRLYTALMLFRQGKLSSGAAAELAGVPRILFFDLCAEHEIPVSQITPEELAQELA
jgi:predicted HTH domain antitoxin